MYEQHFGLAEKPFSLLPDTAFVYMGEGHADAYTILQYGVISQAGFTVVTGEIGCGKTTLVRYLLNELDQNVTVGLISNTHRAFGDLLQWVCLAFGLDHRGKDRVTLYSDFVDFMLKEYALGRRTVLILDEAQNLGAEGLEELRTLSNINADKDQVLQLILVGQPQLRSLLISPELAQFAQRVSAHKHLGPLQEGDTKRYIRHRIARAGGDPFLFSHRVCKDVHWASGGRPRLINTLCDTGMLYAYGAGRSAISQALIREVIQDKRDSGFFGAEAHVTSGGTITAAVSPAGGDR